MTRIEKDCFIKRRTEIIYAAVGIYSVVGPRIEALPILLMIFLKG